MKYLLILIAAITLASCGKPDYCVYTPECEDYPIILNNIAADSVLILLEYPKNGSLWDTRYIKIPPNTKTGMHDPVWHLYSDKILGEDEACGCAIYTVSNGFAIREIIY